MSKALYLLFYLQILIPFQTIYTQQLIFFNATP